MVNIGKIGRTFVNSFRKDSKIRVDDAKIRVDDAKIESLFQMKVVKWDELLASAEKNQKALENVTSKPTTSKIRQVFSKISDFVKSKKGVKKQANPLYEKIMKLQPKTVSIEDLDNKPLKPPLRHSSLYEEAGKVKISELDKSLIDVAQENLLKIKI